MQERRQRERVPFEIAVELHRGSEWVRLEHTRDLSMGGIQLESTVALEMNAPIELKFCPDIKSDLSEIVVSGTVVRVVPQGAVWLIGVRFDSMPSDVSLYFYQIIQYHKV